MAKKYISTKTAYLYKAATGKERNSVLIYGDEVEVISEPPSGRSNVSIRNLTGYVDKDKLKDKAPLELYFIDVGQGDSTFIVTPNRKTILIDGGINNRAYGFLAWKYRLDKWDSSSANPAITIDLLVLSHADEDHIKGLMPIIKHPAIKINQIIQSGIATYAAGKFVTGLGDLDSNKKFLITRHDRIGELNKEDLSDCFSNWKDSIDSKGIKYGAVDVQSPAIILDPEINLQILGPILSSYNNKPAYIWFGEEPLTINGHSVVLMMKYCDVSILFPGDINEKGSAHILGQPGITTALSAHVLKAPHHGSHDFHEKFLEAVRPQIGVISSGNDPDHGHPRAIFMGTIGKYSRSASPLLFCTEIAASFVEEKLDKAEEMVPGELLALDTAAGDADLRARILFKRRLHGMINVRTDGLNIFAARRVTAGYHWEAYGPLAPAP